MTYPSNDPTDMHYLDPRLLNHPESTGALTRELWERLWNPCEQPERPIDMATVFSGWEKLEPDEYGERGTGCPKCLMMWRLWGCPLPAESIPWPPDDAPKLRDYPVLPVR